MNAPCVTLWIGERLGPVERACFKSILRHGHPLALYCYRKPDGVPEGVEIRAAADVIAEDRVYFHRRNSIAPFSDWFRYELQERGAGIWLDTDVYLLAPIKPGGDVLFGEESPGMINNGVLRLAAGSEALAQLLGPVRERRPPAWMPPRRLVDRLLRRAEPTGDPRSWPWGIMGPTGLTHVARKLGIASLAQPPEVFHPVHWSRAGWIRNPAIGLDEVIGPRTVAVHLWNECIASFKNEPAPGGSFLHRIQAEGVG